MKRGLNIAVRVVTLGVVATPLLLYFILHLSIHHSVREACAADDYSCRIDALDEHTTP